MEPLEWVQTGGIAGLLLWFFVLGGKRFWVFGWVYAAKEREAEEWKQLALRGTDLANKNAENTEVSMAAVNTAIAAIEAARRKDILDAKVDNIQRKKGES